VIHCSEGYISLQNLCRSLQLSLGAQRGAKFLYTGTTKNYDKNTNIFTTVNLKLVDFLANVKPKMAFSRSDSKRNQF